jgi:AcrR family transcriptional regulator
MALRSGGQTDPGGRTPTGRRTRQGRDAPDRLRAVVEAAVKVFAQKGFRRTQMTDVAKELGVSSGNLYNYVESKEALFFLVLRSTLGSRAGDEPLMLPVPTPAPGTTYRWLKDRLDFLSDFPELELAIERQLVPEPVRELEVVVLELYDALSRLHRGVAAIERSALDDPELLRIFLEKRRGLFERMTRYVASRVQMGAFPPVQDPTATARFMVETTSWAARRRHDDPDAVTISDELARSALCQFVVRAVTCTDGASGRTTTKGSARRGSS